MKVKEKSEKVGLKLNIQKTKIITSIRSHHFIANRWGKSGNSGDSVYFGGAPKSLQMVIVAMKLKDAYTSLVAQKLKRLPAMREAWVQSLGQEDPLEKVTATNSSILAWKIPWTEVPGGLQSMGSQRVGHD